MVKHIGFNAAAIAAAVKLTIETLEIPASELGTAECAEKAEKFFRSLSMHGMVADKHLAARSCLAMATCCILIADYLDFDMNLLISLDADTAQTLKADQEDPSNDGVIWQ